MEKIRLEYTHEGAVARIILDDNGNGNVLDGIMMNELINLLNEFKTNKNLKLITFEGEGKHFSFGASVAEHTAELAGSMIKTFHQIFYTVIDLGIPTMAKISGQCLGGGLELALACNLLFTDESVALGQPEIVLGVFPPPASIILPMKIGSARAEELLISGRSIKHVEGAQSGLLNKVFVDKDALNEGVDAYIEKYILPKSASSLKFAIKAARTSFNHTLLTKLPVVEELYLDQLMATKDANEGIDSFLEKRKPVWENC